MGKASGFFEYERVENGNIEPLERIKNFKEFTNLEFRRNSLEFLGILDLKFRI